MMNQQELEAMSDLQLDTLIAENEGVDFYVDDDGEFLWLKMGGQHGEDIVYSPTNTANHMMPLVFEHGISLIKDTTEDTYFACSHYEELMHDSPTVYNPVEHSNPLRAAAIVYLLMKEGGQ